MAETLPEDPVEEVALVEFDDVELAAEALLSQ